MGVILKFTGALCLCDWIISVTYLVSSGYLEYDRFSLSSSSVNKSQKTLDTEILQKL